MNPILRKIFKVIGWIIGVVVLLVVGLGLYVNASWDKPIERSVKPMKASMDSASIGRGEFLYKNGVLCWMCHGENRQPNTLPSGGAKEDLQDIGPGFGVFYIPNITPDNETGIGQWSDGELVQVIREGLNRKGRPVFIMPSERFQGLSDEDALAIVSYLRSLPPTKNPVPAHEPSLVTKALFTFGVIKSQPQITEAVQAPPRGVTVEWGKYLTSHASTCMDCHSPVNFDNGQFYKDSSLTGGNFPFGKAGVGQSVDQPTFAYGPNLTPDPETGIGTWTEEQFLMAVRVGMRPDSTVLTTHMPYAYLGMWPEEDLRAVYLFLKSVPPVRKQVPPVEFRKEITETSGVPRGEALFTTYCETCHGKAGKGASPTKLILADLAQTIDDTTLRKFIADGQINLRMPSFKKTLTEEQLSDMVAYIRTLHATQP